MFLLFIYIIATIIMLSESAHDKPAIVKQTTVPREKPPRPLIPRPPSPSTNPPPNPQIGSPIPEKGNDERNEKGGSPSVISKTPSNNPHDIDVGEEVKKPSKTKTKVGFIKLKTDESDEDSDNNEQMHVIKLKEEDDDSSSSDEEKTHHKKKKKKRSSSKTESPLLDMTETVTQLTTTVNDTVNAVTKTAIAGIVKQIVKSRQFNIVLVIGTVTVCMGYLLKIIFWK